MPVFSGVDCCTSNGFFMALITLRILDGADRGRVFADAPTPLTIGREEGNPIQLNDERISRFHLKIQEDQGKTVLTDLQSTNGTKVNGEAVQIAILRAGDVIAVGRTLLLVGAREEIAQRLAAIRGVDLSLGVTLDSDEFEDEPSAASLDFELNFSEEPDAEVLLHTLMPPELPDALSPGQAAQLAEMLQYFNLRMRGLIQSVKTKPKSERVTLEQRQWQNLIDLEDRLAGYLRQIGEPGE
jgi:pSer/pThr/pTyr-binding forkhead associated (FHA) protein